MTIGRAGLDMLVCAIDPDGDDETADVLVLRCDAHPGADLVATYDRRHGAVVLICRPCRAVVLSIAVATDPQ